jgi:hypothetical protein
MDVATSVFGFFHKNAYPWTKGGNILYRNLKEKNSRIVGHAVRCYVMLPTLCICFDNGGKMTSLCVVDNVTWLGEDGLYWTAGCYIAEDCSGYGHCHERT